MKVKFDLDNLEQYLGARVKFVDGEESTIREVNRNTGTYSGSHPVYIKTCRGSVSYTLEGKAGFGDTAYYHDIVSIELPKKPEYEVFNVERYADLDTLLERWDEFEKVVHWSNGTAVKQATEGLPYFDKEEQPPVTLGYTLHLYPKKLTKLERIRDTVTFLLREDLEFHTSSYKEYLKGILAVLNEPEEGEGNEQ